MRIKNTAAGGRGIGVGSKDPAQPGTIIEWEPGEIKDVDADVIAKAKKDPANAALLADGGDLVEVTGKASKAADDEGSKK